MTQDFDLLIEQLLTEYITSKNKRKEARYSGANMTQARKMSNNTNISASQKTKQGNRQYVGNVLGTYGIRTNKSEKDLQRVGISKGLGGIIRQDGVNPKKPGARINSKQGHMIVKHVLDNGEMRIGNSGKTEFDVTKRDHLKRYKDITDK